MKRFNYYEFALKNISSCYHLGYDELAAVERDLNDKFSTDHRNYGLEFVEARGV